MDSIGEMENVIQEIDDCMSERIDDRPPDRDRVTRLLIGRIDDQELRFPLFKDKLTIGRTKQNDIQLNAQHVSRRHAVITTEGDVARVVDWGSKNGVYVNSKRVTEHFLKNGDIVTIGIAEFRYEELRKRDN
jgi:pSer/pThr/pTyr-binding forkhead associated (FHA) protein